MKYLILENPGYNRVYYSSSDKLALAELNIAVDKCSIKCEKLEIIKVEGVRYISIDSSDHFTNSDLQILSKLSFIFAIFRAVEVDGKTALLPIAKYDYEYLDGKIGTILKYHGKTNELFTKMMVNVALLSSNFSYDDNIKLLDPVAGRGTTLFQGSVYGFNCSGVEIDSNAVHESQIFFKKYLETERVKHSLTKRELGGGKRGSKISFFQFDYCKDKDDFKSIDKAKRLEFVSGNTQECSFYFKNSSFHLIVGDLPYGIVHGNTGGKRKGSLTRNPSELLADSLSDWSKLLKKGGVAVLAWNSYLAPRTELAKIFNQHGFETLDEKPYDQFEHMVDRSIKRDIIVARKL